MAARGWVAPALLTLAVVGVVIVVLRIRTPPDGDRVSRSDARAALTDASVDSSGRAAPGADGKRGASDTNRAGAIDPQPDRGEPAGSSGESGEATAIGGRIPAPGRIDAARSRNDVVEKLPARKAGADAIDAADEQPQMEVPAGTRFAAPLSGTTTTVDGTTPLVERNTDHDVADGVYFPPDAQLAYPNRSGVQADAGTVALWVEPVDWAGNDASVHSLFSINDPAGRDYRFHILKDSRDLRFQFVTDHGENNLFVPIDWWPRGEGHHVAVTWGDSTLRVFVDGVPLRVQGYEGTLNVTPVAPGWWGSTAEGGVQGAGAILKQTLVADRAMHEREIQGLWEGP
jgi:hypothetical protein